MKRQKRFARGYTAIELLMSIGILGIGVTGVVAMQKVTVTSNQHAKNLAIATQIGQAWMEQLRLDGLQWVGTDSTTNPPSTTWLGAHLPTNDGIGSWSLPAWNDTRGFGSAFNALGAPFDPDGGATPAAFCTNIRLTRVLRTSTALANAGLIRAEVRVYWLRDGQGTFGGSETTPPPAFCSEAEDPTEVGAHPDRYHMVYDVSAVRQNLFP